MDIQPREKEEERLLLVAGQPSTERFFIGKWEKIYLLIIEWGVYLALFTPLVLVRNAFYPFMSPKTIFFRAVVDIVFIAYILLILSNRKYLPKFNLLTTSVTVFLGIVFLTSLTGINFENSFWGGFQRMTGLLTFLHLFAFFIILVGVFDKREYWEKLITVSVISGVLVSLYTFIIDYPVFSGAGTFGNISFLTSYMLFNIFFALTLLFVKTGVWRTFCGLALIPMLWVLLFPPLGRSTGAIVAFFGGIILLAAGFLLFYWFPSASKILKRLVIALMILVILGGIGITQTDLFQGELKTMQQSSSWWSRTMVWGMSFAAWQERPLLGFGQENLYIPLTHHFNPTLPITINSWYDRAHNIILDTVGTSGIMGLLSYLSIFVIAVFYLLRICFKATNRKNLLFPLGIIVILLVYFAQNLFTFDTISSYVVFFFTLALIHFLIQEKKTEIVPSPEVKRSVFLPILGVSLITLTVFTLYFCNIQAIRSAKYIVKAIDSPIIEETVPLFQKAIAMSPTARLGAVDNFYRKVSDFIFKPDQDSRVLENAFESAAEELKKSVAKIPEDTRLYLSLGRHYNDFYILTRDKEKLLEAETYLLKAIELSPKHQQPLWSLSETMIYQGREGEAISLAQRAIDFEPRLLMSHWYLSMIYKKLGKDDLALEKLKDAKEFGVLYSTKLDQLKTVINFFQSLKDNRALVLIYPLAIEMLDQRGDQDIIESAQFRTSLGVAFANLGQFDQARYWAEEALKLKPSFAPDIEKFLESLPY